jgi:RNA polymerase sigma-70 factor (ECF subfamily)
MINPDAGPSETVELGSDDGIADDILALRRVLYARAQFLTQDPIDAEDLVQDTLERALLARVHFQSGTNLKAWLCAILRNLFIDTRRRNLVHRRLDRELCNEPRQSDPVEAPEPRDLISLEDIAQSLECLSAADRKIFMMFYHQRLSYREIGAQLDVRSSTVGTRLLRSRLKVRASLLRLIEAQSSALPSRPAPAGL